MAVWGKWGSGRDFRFFRVPISTLRMKRIALFSRKKRKDAEVFCHGQRQTRADRLFTAKAQRTQRNSFFFFFGRYRKSKRGLPLRGGKTFLARISRMPRERRRRSPKRQRTKRVFATDKDRQERTDFSPQRHRGHRDNFHRKGAKDAEKNIFYFAGRCPQSKTTLALRAEKPGTTQV